VESLNYDVRTAPVYTDMHQHMCARYKSQTLAATPSFGHTKILHTLIGMGSAALARLCLTQVRRPEIPVRERERERNALVFHFKARFTPSILKSHTVNTLRLVSRFGLSVMRQAGKQEGSRFDSGSAIFSRQNCSLRILS